MRYCCNCGEPIEPTLKSDSYPHISCHSCGSTIYLNPRIIVGCAASYQDKVLMCRRAEEPARGLWTLPSVYLECGETLEEGATRETLEETGVIIKPEEIELRSIWNLTAIQEVVIIFSTEFESLPTVFPGIECLEVAFLSERDIAPEKLAWRQAMGHVPEGYFKDLQSGRRAIELLNAAGADGSNFKARKYSVSSIDTTGY